MQRINENTYIDNTLVTCAEYQLFIDEMRERGKYHQPDHWISYQFPHGRSREPILGVRHSDAVGFCEWLEKREHDRWKYRLPTETEAMTWPLRSEEKGPFTCWLSQDYQFTWINSKPQNNRQITSDVIRSLEKEAVNLDVRSSISRAQNRPLDTRHDLDLSRGYSSGLANELELLCNRDLNINNNLSEDLLLALEFDRAVARDRVLARDRARNLSLKLAQQVIVETTPDRNDFLDIFVDIVTLQERILGNSPAFEGIRLVKERTG